MRCPKCQYLGFDGQERCRNCGYDFSLSRTLPTSESPVDQGPGADAPDLPLRTEPTARERARAAIRQRQAASHAPGAEAFDLPLFEAGAEAGTSEPQPPAARDADRLPPDLPPIVSASPTPRPPLAVRRPTEPPRARGGVALAPVPPEPVLDLDLSPGPPPLAITIDPTPADPMPVAPGVAEGETGRAASPEVPADRAAPIGARVVAGLIDAAILATIDVIVVSFTLQLTGVSWAEMGRLPIAPLAAFLALLATGYLTMFTVLAGQTAGKMVTGIRVVESEGRPVRFGHAVLRAAVQVCTVPLLGLGFLPALLAADRRALYDRLSDTEVIRSDA